MLAQLTVISNATLALVAFGVLIVLLLVLIAKLRWHVFFALLIPIVLLGAVPGIERSNFIAAFKAGFGKTLGDIGVVIVLGSIIAEALKHTGAIQVITRSMVRLVGARRMPLALTLSGFVLGVAIFSDVAYVILNPIVHSAAGAARSGIATMSIGLVGALQLTHAIVPPTPGPMAAAIFLGADIGKTIFYGGIACLTGSLASWLWGQYVVGPRITTPPSQEFLGQDIVDDAGELPSTLSAYAPIVVPIVLIFSQSVALKTLDEESVAFSILTYLGWPVVALVIGVFLAYRNIRSKSDRAKAKTQWVEDGLRASAMILVVTGLGGSLSAILKGTPAVDSIAQIVQDSGVPAIFLPFVLGIIGNMITGSSQADVALLLVPADGNFVTSIAKYERVFLVIHV